jgi:serine/threonine protein kinase
MVAGPRIAESDPPSRHRSLTQSVRKEGHTMGVEAQSGPLTGKMLGRYRILSRLAVGGMAELWLALSTSKGETQKVVLKTMLPGVAESREFVRMFQTEATIGSRLRHPNLVRVLDYGRLADRYFIAMEYIDGLTLRQIGQRFHEMRCRFPPRLLLSLVVEVCRGLHTAHELRDRGGLVQFIHRDVSPENIMVTRQGVAKLIDFGAASTLRIKATTGRFVGKFRYVAPERIEGKKEDRRCDIYALGVILYEYLTGVRPFEGDDLAMMARILEGPPRPPGQLVRDLPTMLQETVLKALALQPEDRHPTAGALAAELLPLVDGRSLPMSLELEQQLLQQAFEAPVDAAADADASTPTETDAKTVEMEVDALKEVLSRTREEPTVVRRMRLERRGRTVVGEARERPSVRPPAARNGARRSLHIQTLSGTPLPDLALSGAAVPLPAGPQITLPATPDMSLPAEETRPLPEHPPRIAGRLADALLLADALPMAADTPPEPPPPDSESFSAVAPQPPLIAPPPVEPASAIPPSWLFERRTTTAAEGLFPERPTPSVPGWFDIARPETQGGKVLDRVDRPSLVEDVRASDETANQRRRVPLPEAVRCFDRGLSLLQDKLFAAALEEWERAAVLDPDNRMYQVNLKRLRQRVSNPTSPNPRSVLNEHEKRESQ